MQNGGYVLKPSFMLHDSKIAKIPEEFTELSSVVEIRIISG